jgi:hypothetical protein
MNEMRDFVVAMVDLLFRLPYAQPTLLVVAVLGFFVWVRDLSGRSND